MALNKQNKPRWADGAAPYTIEPSESKKNVGWLSQEKPPYQWMNWLFLKIKQWLDWGEERTEQIESTSFHTTGAAVTWSGTQMVVPAGGLIIEWRSRNTIVNNIIPAATYTIADGEYLIFVPHTVSGTVLASGTYGALTAGQYAQVLAAALIDNTTLLEQIICRRRGGVLEFPIFKTAVQAGGALAANDLLVHNHSDADDGGTLTWANIFSVAGAGTHGHSSTTDGGGLDWDTCWTDAVHTHGSNAEGGTLDWDTCWADAVHDHSSDAEGGVLTNSPDHHHSGTAGDGSNELTIGAGSLKTDTSTFEGEDIYEHQSNSDTAEVSINRIGYQGGITKNRKTVIYDGKGNICGSFSKSAVTLYENQGTSQESGITADGRRWSNADTQNVSFVSRSRTLAAGANSQILSMSSAAGYGHFGILHVAGSCVGAAAAYEEYFYGFYEFVQLGDGTEGLFILNQFTAGMLKTNCLTVTQDSAATIIITNVSDVEAKLSYWMEYKTFGADA